MAFFGHNLVHVVRAVRLPGAGVIFLIASVVILSKSHPGAPAPDASPGGFLITLGAAFGYAAGWNPYASDYTRYLKPDVNRRAIGLWAGLGLFLSCVLLEIVGAAAGHVTERAKLRRQPDGRVHRAAADRLADADPAGHRARRDLRPTR